MEKPFKFTLPSPNFNKKDNNSMKIKPHFLTPSGMTLLPREKQPPPMFGSRGSTVPAKFLTTNSTTNPEPEEEYFCESCDLKLQSLNDYKRHRAQHEKCPVEGCNYKGHPSVMDKHVVALHSSGLFEKFKKLSTPEELTAWREERKKRYPTVANVLLKQKAKEQKQKRGERLEANTSRFGSENNRKRAMPANKTQEGNVLENNRNKKRKSKDKRKGRNENKMNASISKEAHKNSTVTQVAARDSNVVVDVEACNGIPRFLGTSQMEDYNHICYKRKKEDVIEIKHKNALSNLLSMYGSDSEESGTSDSEIELKVENENDLRLKKNYSMETNNSLDMSKLKSEGTQSNEVEPTFDLTKDQVSTINPEEECADKLQDEISDKSTSLKLNDEASRNEEESLANNKEQSLANNKEESLADNKAESSDEMPEEIPIGRTDIVYSLPKPLNSASTDNSSGSSSVQKPSNNQTKQSKSDVPKRTKPKSGLNYRNIRLRKQNTMLEKLLESDIRHERNVLLQCVRYVCENDFFKVAPS